MTRLTHDQLRAYESHIVHLLGQDNLPREERQLLLDISTHLDALVKMTKTLESQFDPVTPDELAPMVEWLDTAFPTDDSADGLGHVLRTIAATARDRKLPFTKALRRIYTFCTEDPSK